MSAQMYIFNVSTDVYTQMYIFNVSTDVQDIFNKPI